MPHTQLTIPQACAYLATDKKHLLRLVSRDAFSARKIGDGEFLFRKSALDAWVWASLASFDRKTICAIEAGICAHHGLDPARELITPLLNSSLCIPALAAKTRRSVIQELVTRADENHKVWAKEDLIHEIHDRSEECVTELLPPVAFPHPSHPVPYDIAETFLAVGIHHSGLAFGSPRGDMSHLFFLLCVKEETAQIHLLLRLFRMLHEPGVVHSLLDCQTPTALAETLATRETALLLE
ncbi:MAG: PTS transporter subunit EIIA [Phycisphaerales bacterium]|jgi:nitrogen PTS system EIIA component|nr:PTS transporter subunit EIIA [Phycisphaerales bacterium]MBT7170802.1 PTS transporter subunit EIIA [Phycisphaerales bacterium]